MESASLPGPLSPFLPFFPPLATLPPQRYDPSVRHHPMTTKQTPPARPVLRQLGRFVPALLLVALTTLGLFFLRDQLSPATKSLIYMLVTLIAAVWLGTGPSVLAAVAGFFAINFFFVEPYYTLDIATTRDLLSLLIYLAAALIAGRLAAYAQRQAAAAGLTAEQQAILYDLTSALNPLIEPGRIQAELRQVLVRRMGAEQVDFLPHDPAWPHDPARRRDPAGNAVFVLLEAGDAVYGTARVVFPATLSGSQHRLLLACAGQAALALQRVDLTGQAARSRTLAEADRLKTAILRAVSHDLRTPITIIKTSAANLDELGDRLSAGDRRELAQSIEAQADELDRLVGNLLDLSRLQAGAVVLHRELNSLEEIAGEVAARAYAAHHAERITLDFPDDLPLTHFDYGLMVQALGNIVDNALRHEPAGTRVIIRGRVTGDEARVMVINHGPSIDPDEREKLMLPFHQSRADRAPGEMGAANDGRSTHGGVGLGLAIARGILEAHHGDIRVEDTPGGGATFMLILPLDSRDERRTTQAAAPPPEKLP